MKVAQAKISNFTKYGLFAALLLSLPLFLWAVLTQNFSILNRAGGSGNAPVIVTQNLETAQAGQPYSEEIVGYDTDPGTQLLMFVSNYPEGMDSGPCNVDVTENGRPTVSCMLTGTPTQPGEYEIRVSLMDTNEGQSDRVLTLVVN